MSDEAAVLAAARARAAALESGSASLLTGLLHPRFRWTAHTGETFDRAAYVEANTAGRTRWRSQDLGDAHVMIVGDTGVLRAIVTDVVETAAGEQVFRMPMTQVWVRGESGWRCLAGHAGPRLSRG